MENPGSFFCPTIIIIIVVGIIFIWINAANQAKENKEISKTNYEIRQNDLKKSDFVADKFIQLPILSTEVRVDIEHKKLAILHSMYSRIKFLKFSEILSCETVQDNSTIMSGGVGRAIAGGILAGGAGAIVGATTRKSNDVVSDLRIKITTNNISDPLITIKLITSQIDKSSSLYKQCIEFAEEVQATIESIISQQ